MTTKEFYQKLARRWELALRDSEACEVLLQMQLRQADKLAAVQAAQLEDKEKEIVRLGRRMNDLRNQCKFEIRDVLERNFTLSRALQWMCGVTIVASLLAAGTLLHCYAGVF